MDTVIGKEVGNEFRSDSDILIESFNSISIFQITEVPMIAVYEKPVDYPGKFVARLMGIVNGSPAFYRYVVTRETLEELRETIPPFMAMLQRSPEDDPKIVGMYI